MSLSVARADSATDLLDIVDAAYLQEIQDSFADATGLATRMMGPTGTWLTRPSRLALFCSLVRSTPEGVRLCRQATARYPARESGTIVESVCPAGLHHITADIVWQGQLLATICVEEVAYSPIPEVSVRRLARRLGVAPESLMEAATRIECVESGRVQRAMNLLSCIARHITRQVQLATENLSLSQAAQQQAAQAKALLDVAATVNASLDLDTVLQAVINQATSRLRADIGTIHLGETTKHVAHGEHFWGLKGQLCQAKAKPSLRGLNGEILRTGRPLRLSDRQEHPNSVPLPPGHVPIGPLLGVPILVKGKCVADIFLARAPGGQPFTWEDEVTLTAIANQAAVAIENALLFRDTSDLFLGTISALVAAIDEKSRWTAGHSERVAAYALATAEKMGLPKNFLHDLGLAGLLHDIGKIGIPETLLDKPARLTEEEFALVKQHPAKGARIIEGIKQLGGEVRDGVYCHHERYDGQGYPEKLTRDEIPLAGRILAVGDVFDAMTHERPYRAAFPPRSALEHIAGTRGILFDPAVVAAFLQAVDERTGQVHPGYHPLLQWRKG